MHKWKDKVEFSLDNRQIFFLFFGLSVVGCFIFALGIMTGRRIDWQPGGDVEALADGSLEMLEEGDVPERFAFEQGLSQSEAADLPPTREPGTPPRDEDEVKAEKAAIAAGEEPPRPGHKIPKAAPTPAPKSAKKSPVPPKGDAVMANAAGKAGKPNKADAPAPKSGSDKDAKRIFTLQFKAFSRKDDAEKFADKLRRNGHDVRIETATVRGREWHRVRLGSFDTWEKGLAAKAEFEKAEHVIAYVVSQ